MRFVITRCSAIRGAAKLGGDDRAERNSKEIEKRSGKSPQGFFAPMSILTHAPIEQRVITTTLPAGGPGGNLISTDYRGDQFIDLLRPNSIILSDGSDATHRLGRQYRHSWLKVDTTFAMVAENTALTASDAQVDRLHSLPRPAALSRSLADTSCYRPQPERRAICSPRLRGKYRNWP